MQISWLLRCGLWMVLFVGVALGAVNAIINLGSADLSVGLALTVLLSAPVLAVTRAVSPWVARVEMNAAQAARYRLLKLRVERVALFIGLIAGVLAIVNGIITFVEKIS
jgi:hypothetical protein